MTPPKHALVRAYARWTKMPGPHLENLLRLAEEEDAPHDAWCRCPKSGRWKTLRDLQLTVETGTDAQADVAHEAIVRLRQNLKD